LKLLFDENLSPSLVPVLEALLFPDSAHVHALELILASKRAALEAARERKMSAKS
jgi:predicted nuclease of predicted toxin-antitoxin system